MYKTLLSWPALWDDCRHMGIGGLIPLIGSLLLFIFLFSICYLGGLDESFYLLCSEAALPFFGSWWSLFLLRPLLELPGGSLYFTFPVSRTYFGLVRTMRIYLFFVLWLGLYAGALSLLTDSITLSSFWILLAAQSFFFFGLGFLAMTITRNAMYGWVVAAAYALFFLLTRNQFLPLLSIYTLAAAPMEFDPLLQTYGLKAFCLALPLWLAAHLIFRYLQPPDDD